MARKIWCKQSDISRLEREGYCGYSINQLYKITKALNLKIEIKLIPKEMLIDREESEVEEFSKELIDKINATYQNANSGDVSKVPSSISSAHEDHQKLFEEEEGFRTIKNVA